MLGKVGVLAGVNFEFASLGKTQHLAGPGKISGSSWDGMEPLEFPFMYFSLPKLSAKLHPHDRVHKGHNRHPHLEGLLVPDCRWGICMFLH